MASRTITSDAGLSATLKVQLVKDDGQIWDNVGLNVETFVLAQVTRYDLTLTETATGSGIYTYTIPPTLPVGTWRERLRDTTNGFMQSREVFTWSGAVVTGSPSVGANQTTLGELVTVLETTARKAGRGTATGPYDLTEKHLSIQAGLESLIRRTKCTMRTDTLALDEDDDTIDFSSITGFRTNRIFKIWAYPDDGSTMSTSQDVRVVELDEISEYRNCNGEQSGHPYLIGFGLQDGTNNQTALVADQDYVVKIRHYATLVSWTAGDTGASSTVINMSGDLAKQAVQLYSTYWLQGCELEHLPITDRRRAAWEEFISQNMGAENLGSRSIRRLSLDEVRDQRRGW